MTHFQFITFILNASDTGHFSDATSGESRVRTTQQVQLVTFAPETNVLHLRLCEKTKHLVVISNIATGRISRVISVKAAN